MLDTMVMLTQVGRPECWDPRTGSVGGATWQLEWIPVHTHNMLARTCAAPFYSQRVDGCTASPCRVRPTQCLEQWSAVCACMLPPCAESTPCLAAATAAGYSSVMLVCCTVSSVVQSLSRSALPGNGVFRPCKLQLQAHTSSMHQA
jgi:hypothetical protein